MAASRRLPPPCWSNDETVALIQVYRDKWYSLRRGNLRAPDWQDVADGVAARCTLPNPPKTSIQCRHKMEKLRKRYRSEIQRINGHRRPSSWIHFNLLDSMELGTSSSDSAVNFSNQDDDGDEEDLNRRYQGSIDGNSSRIGVRIKIPNGLIDDLPPPVDPKYGSGNGGVKRKDNVMDEMVAAIRKLGDGFVKMERMKMDMARELESMRMKMEIKQTEMVLETHRKMWDSLTERAVENKSKKPKRMPTPDS